MRKLVQPPSPNDLPKTKKEPKIEPPQNKRARILVVDDDAMVRNVLCSELSEHHLGEAEDGIRGLELFKNGEFDLVITDLKMPRMGGMELLAEIKMINPDARVIVISGFLETQAKEMLESMGAALVLEKPMGVVEISEHVARLLPG